MLATLLPIPYTLSPFSPESEEGRVDGRILERGTG